MPTKKAEARITLPPDKPLRDGARARKLLASLKLPKKREKEVRDKAVALARRQELPGGRSESILRDYYIYLAMEMEMPPTVAKQWEHFQRTGKELPGSGARAATEDTGKAPADGEKNVAEPSAEGTATPSTPSDDVTL